jgi:hypothetical protein
MVATWTPEMAARRLALVRRSLQASLSAEQRAELEGLTETLREQTRPMFVDMCARIDAALAAPARGGAPGIAGLPACRECGSFEACEHDAGRETENAW